MHVELSSDTIIRFLLLINLFVALCMIISGFFARQEIRPMRFLYGILSLLGPVVIPLFLGISLLLEKIQCNEEVDMQDVSMDKTREKILLPPDMQAEMNYVPIRDALDLSNLSDLRRLLIDLLKYHSDANIGSIAVAMNSTDTEVSHYAASAIQDVLSDYRSNSHRLLEKMYQYPDDAEINLAALEYLYTGLHFQIMSETEQRAYIYTTETVAENLYKHNTWFMTARHYDWMIQLFLSIRDFTSADKWMERALVCRPKELDTYKSHLRLLYVEHRRQEFFDCLNEVRNSRLDADSELLDLIRLYANEPIL